MSLIQSAQQLEEQSSAPLILEPSPGEISGTTVGTEAVPMQGVVEEQVVIDLLAIVSEQVKAEEEVDPSSVQSHFETDCFILMGTSSFAFSYKM